MIFLKKKRYLVIFLTIQFLFSFISPNFCSATTRFNDVDAYFWGYNTIIELADKSYINGYEDGTFRPNQEITREEFASLIVRVLNLSATHSIDKTYEDISDDRWSADNVYLLKEYLSGYEEDGKLYFKPLQKISREEAASAVGLWLMSKSNISVSDKTILDIFSDKDQIKDSLKNSIAEVVNAGIMQGYPSIDNMTLFKPKNTLTRAEVAEIMLKLLRRIEAQKKSTLEVSEKETSQLELFLQTDTDKVKITNISTEEKENPNYILFKWKVIPAANKTYIKVREYNDAYYETLNNYNI